MSFFTGGMSNADSHLLDVFADQHIVGGKLILAVLDQELFSERTSHAKGLAEYAEGVWLNGTILFCKTADLGFRPEVNDLLDIDGKDWQVVSCELGEGLLTVTLLANES